MNHNLIQSFRSLKKNLTYTIFTFIGLTIGITIFVLSGSFISSELTVDDYFKNNDRTLLLFNPEDNECGLDFDLAQTIRDNYPQVAFNVAVERDEWPSLLRSNTNHFKVKGGISTTNDFFKVFPEIQVISKIEQKPFADLNSVIITKSVADKLFGIDNPLGKSINIDNYIDATVSAVINDFPKNCSFSADYLINADNEDNRFSWTCNNNDYCFNPSNHLLLLNDGVDKNEFITTLNESIGSHQSRIHSFDAIALNDCYLSEPKNGYRFNTGNTKYLIILTIISIIIVFLAIINYINFTLSIQKSKVKEISIKKINGAGSRNILAYYGFQNWLLLTVVAMVSLLLAKALTPFASYIFDKEIITTYIFNTPLLLSLLGILALITCINSIIPIYSAIKINVIDGINNRFFNINGINIKPALVAIQFTISIVLLLSVLIISKQLRFVNNQNLGFNHDKLIKLEIPFEFQHVESLKNEINKLSFVESSTVSTGCPGFINMAMGSGNDTEVEEFMLSCIFIDEHFFETFQIDLLNGKPLNKSQKGNICFINESAFKKYEWDSFENKRFRNWSDDGYSVQGITSNFNISSMHESISPVCLIYDEAEANTLSIRLSAGNTKQQLTEIEKVWQKITPDYPIDYAFYDTFFENMYRKEQLLAKSIGILAAIAILLTVIGILGQVMQNCIEKTKEIGIRKVNGANELEIVKLLNRDFLLIMLIGFVLACPIAYYSMSKWLELFAYKTELSWWIFASGGLIASTIVVISISWLTIIAAKKNPVEALRYE